MSGRAVINFFGRAEKPYPGGWGGRPHHTFRGRMRAGDQKQQARPSPVRPAPSAPFSTSAPRATPTAAHHGLT